MPKVLHGASHVSWYLMQKHKLYQQICTQCSPRMVWIVKKMQGKSEGAMRTGLFRASKRAPIWWVWPTTPLSHLWPVESRPDPEAGHKRDIGVVGQTHQVGSLFEALNECVLIAPSDLPCIFFTIQTIIHEHCACVTSWCAPEMLSVQDELPTVGISKNVHYDS